MATVRLTLLNRSWAPLPPTNIPSSFDTIVAMERSSGTQLATIQWPRDVLPTEIFDQIIQYLSSPDVRRMMLVCREFRYKIIANYLHTFAARFRPDFCLPAPGPSAPLSGDCRNILLQHGNYVRRFSLSLEIDENVLARPPMRPDHKLVQELWGLYLWPNDEYNRHGDLMDLEAAADDTKAMEATLRTLVNATDISVSCDPGWGRILGAEKYLVAAKVFRGNRQKIGLPTLRGRATSQHTRFPKIPKPSPENGAQRMKSVHKKMVRDAGIPKKKVKAALEYIASNAPLAGNDSTITLAQSSPGLAPDTLKTAQKKLLVELEWASRALVLS